MQRRKVNGDKRKVMVLGEEKCSILKLVLEFKYLRAYVR